MAEITINGVLRTEFGKGASRRARRDGLVPAVLNCSFSENFGMCTKSQQEI